MKQRRFVPSATTSTSATKLPFFLSFCLLLLWSLLFCANARATTLQPGDAVNVATESAVVLRAARDVARDLGLVLGAPVAVTQGPTGRLSVAIDSAIRGPEAYRIVVRRDEIRLLGADELGAVYALYDFSQRYLGVDPLWFWTDRTPAKRRQIELPEGTIEQPAARFRYRGLFINDEDLLGRWRPAAGERFGDFPERGQQKSAALEADYQRKLQIYYGPIVNYDVMEMVFETLLRLHGNLVIPASFVDIMNPAEAELVRRAAARGLYVSQHHVEPMGVSFFALMSYWARQGKQTAFSYPSERELFHRAWRAYAEKWYELAGDHVIWQLGLRGRGDRAVWMTDPAFDRSKAGEMISEALATQVKIIQQIDRRPAPPMTLTLWLEMSDLLTKGSVQVPPGVIFTHTDHHDHAGAVMNKSFEMPREPGRPHAAYLHVAVWGNGPHLVQGVDHDALIRLIDSIADQGDTTYAIVNASNVREHVLSLRTALDRLWRSDAPSALRSSVPPAAVPLYQRLVELQRISKSADTLMNDGRCCQLIYRLLRQSGQSSKDAKELAAALARNADALLDLAREAAHLPLSASEAEFIRHNLAEQATILAGMYRAAAALYASDRDHGLRQAREALTTVHSVFAQQNGKWENWYRGDTKVNIAEKISLINRQLEEGVSSGAKPKQPPAPRAKTAERRPTRLPVKPEQAVGTLRGQ